MKSRRRTFLMTRRFIVAGLAFCTALGQLAAAESPETLAVDKIVTNPAKFKGTVSVVGRVAKISANGLFALSCEDACVAMPVKFFGSLPHAGSEVIVRGQVTKDPSGRYVFNAESVTAKK